jgi:hypothetical protein
MRTLEAALLCGLRGEPVHHPPLTVMGRDTPKDTPARSTCYLPAAPPARHGLEDLYLFAVFAFDHMADVDHAAVAAVGFFLLGGWVRGCASEWIARGGYPYLGHSSGSASPSTRPLAELSPSAVALRTCSWARRNSLRSSSSSSGTAPIEPYSRRFRLPLSETPARAMMILPTSSSVSASSGSTPAAANISSALPSSTTKTSPVSSSVASLLQSVKTWLPYSPPPRTFSSSASCAPNLPSSSISAERIWNRKNFPSGRSVRSRYPNLADTLT